eukprot:TRINITY_DN4794_c0_g1_i1.p2 TRINITY_DN4794_c0_g1~~TRINITY_DN4794_c0_g1_i1.p2  ORF type:complete len:166 (-),score=42.44 TRINITY_DN4794_c0_g1_i1:2379-2876(-)
MTIIFHMRKKTSLPTSLVEMLVHSPLLSSPSSISIEFHKKYQRFAKNKQKGKESRKEEEKKEMSKEKDLVQEREENLFDFPKEYDKRYRVNFSILSQPPDRTEKRSIPGNFDIKGARNALHFYEDFLQKKKFFKIEKISKVSQHKHYDFFCLYYEQLERIEPIFQ